MKSSSAAPTEKKKVKRTASQVDEFQQRHPAVGFPVAVWRKFSDDQAGNLATLIAYWAFFSVFPLLLVAVTVIGFVGIGSGTFHDVIGQFPLIGNDVQGIHGNVVALVVGILTALWSGLAVVKATQTAFDAVWEVPMADRPSFLNRIVAGVKSLAVLAVGFVVALGLTGIATGGKAQHVSLPVVLRLLVGLVAVGLDVAMFTLAYRWLTKRELSFREVLPGSVFAGLLIVVLQLTGTALITHAASGQKGATGTVATVLGLLWWFSLQATVVLYGAEINVVRVEGLWPRGLVDAPETQADHRAYEAYVEEKAYRPNQSVDTTFHDEVGETERPADTGSWRHRKH